MPRTEAASSWGVEPFLSILLLCFFGMAGAIPGIAPNQAIEMTGAAPSGLMTAVGLGSQLLVDAAIALLLLRSLPRLARLSWTMQWSAALALLAILSVAWSEEPLLTARRSLPFALSAGFGLYLAARFSPDRQRSLVQSALLILALATIVAALGFPSIGLDASTGHFGNWQGVFTQKNACGRAMVFASAAVLSRGRFAPGTVLALAVFLGVLLMSGSRGAWAIELLLLGAMALLYAMRKIETPARAWLVAAAGVFALGAIGLARALYPLLTALAGRDATLTGRTAIWAEVWRAILRRPWLGYGFSAFWRGLNGASFDVVVALKFVLFHAHNGFLEVWLELGAAGLLLFLLSYVRGWCRLWPAIRRGDLRTAAWPACVLLLIAAYDLDENTLLSFNGLYWVLYVSALVQIELLAKRALPLRRSPAVRLRAPSAALPLLAPTGAAWL